MHASEIKRSRWAHPGNATSLQAVKEGRLRHSALQPDERMRRPGLSTLVLDEADLMLSMPGYEEDLQAIAPLVHHPHQLLQHRTCRPPGHVILGTAVSIGTMSPQHLLHAIDHAIILASTATGRCRFLHMHTCEAYGIVLHAGAQGVPVHADERNHER